MTAQIPEVLLHRSMTLSLCSCPLGYYLDRLSKSRRPRFLRTSTACVRGYVGTWEIRDRRLWLVAVEGLIETPEGVIEADLETALPWVRGPLPATWLTDRVRCPQGRLFGYVHMGFASRYERDRCFEFERGRLLAEWLVLNPPEPIIYRIDERGERTCVDAMCWWDERVIPDPLGEHGVEDAHLAWGRPPAEDEGGESGYVVAAACTHPPR